ncbi:DUF3450 domain-containing protein [Neobacillus sedimentimangrovi]|uniref:DUF3450 domain-containing protein n=1 Tax=Neobacillus sedimentimangrovi TaxID=2699460 RepID=UPI0013D69BA8|nr:DUF3450 domain-containing protein [Neobacillus sedimentimangrovi]
MNKNRNKNKRLYITPLLPQEEVDYSYKTLSKFKYKPPNNTGVILGIIGGALATVGDALATIGSIIQLDIDVEADFQSQLDDFKSDQEKEKMQEEIDTLKGQVKEIEDLKEQLKQLETLIKSNQN